MTLWAAHPHPKNDEVLSSWIARISYANHMRIPVFCEFALGVGIKQLLAVDYGDADEIVEKLVHGTGVSEERIRESSLLTEHGYIFHSANSLPISWVVPTKYKKKSLSPGLNYCPRCLEEDPYFRKSWRFSFYPVCLSHKVLLRQLCPHCQKPFHYIGSSLLISGSDSITICKHCGFDLRRFPAQSELKLTNEITASFQRALKEGIELDCFVVNGNESVRAIKYLEGLRHAMSFSTYAKNVNWLLQQFRNEIPSELDACVESVCNRKISLDQRSPQELSIIMLLASIFLKDWPRRLGEFNSAFPPTPKSFSEYRLQFSREEILNARIILKRKIGKNPTNRELDLFMSDGVARLIPRVNNPSSKEIVISPDHFTLEPTDTYVSNSRSSRNIRKKLGKVDKMVGLNYWDKKYVTKSE